MLWLDRHDDGILEGHPEVEGRCPDVRPAVDDKRPSAEVLCAPEAREARPSCEGTERVALVDEDLAEYADILRSPAVDDLPPIIDGRYVARLRRRRRNDRRRRLRDQISHTRECSFVHPRKRNKWHVWFTPAQNGAAASDELGFVIRAQRPGERDEIGRLLLVGQTGTIRCLSHLLAHLGRAASRRGGGSG